MQKIWYLFIGWRIWLCLVLLVGMSLVPQRENVQYTAESLARFSVNFFAERLALPLANFDGIHYLTIAAEGYSTQARFLPMLSTILGVLSVIAGDRTAFSPSQILIAAIFSVIVCWSMLAVFYNLLRIDYSEKQSQHALVCFLAFPTSFFLVSVYPESLFLLLSFGSLLAARKGVWSVAAILAAVATITRLQGIVLLPTLAFEWWQRKKVHPNGSADSARKLLWLGIIPLPFLAYAFFNKMKWGSWMYFVTAHGDLGNSRAVTHPVFVLQTMFRYLKMLLTVNPHLYEWWVAALELSSFVFVCFFLYQAFRKKVYPSYLFYSVGMLLLPAFSGTLTGFPRYGAIIFPIYISLALLNTKIKITYWIFGFSLQALLFVLFARGYFIA